MIIGLNGNIFTLACLVDLFLGNNIINNNLTLHLQSLPGNNTFQITPVNFSPGMTLNYVLALRFEGRYNTPNTKIVLSIGAEMDVMTCNSKRFDGEVNEIVSSTGKRNSLKIMAEKVVHLKDLRNCRQGPYVEEFNKNFLQNLKQHCSRLCKNISYRRECKQLGLVVEELPDCSTKDKDCFTEMISKTRANMTEQPCTQLKYQVQNYEEELPPEETQWELPQRVVFAMSFGNPKAKVFMEYIIYDFVATISAIGGTLGLCIGFSFTGVASILLEHAALLKKKIGTQWNVLELEVGE